MLFSGLSDLLLRSVRYDGEYNRTPFLWVKAGLSDLLIVKFMRCNTASLAPGKRAVTAHWGVDDPASVTAPPDDTAAAFAKTYDEIYRRIMTFLTLDTTKDQRQWLSELQDIGKIDDESAAPLLLGYCAIR